MVVDGHVRREPQVADGLRSRKKARTRLAIEAAASALFAEQGYEATTVEQISERADISHTTFFRYFPSKAHVITLGRDNAQLPLLHGEIIDRPSAEADLVALQRAIQLIWVPAIDPDRTIRTARAVAESMSLRGLYEDMNREWTRAIADALAVRRGLDAADEGCKVVARTAIGVLETAVESWVANDFRKSLGDSVDRNFEALRLAFERPAVKARRPPAKPRRGQTIPEGGSMAEGHQTGEG
jgi:AcrR family transcriptional regulator